MLNDLKKLYDFGFAIHWLRPKSKAPIGAGWTKGPRKSWKQLIALRPVNCNVGVRLGRTSLLSDGMYLGAIDCDVKSSDIEDRQEMMKHLSDFIDFSSAPICLSGRGNGSQHIYVRSEAPLKPRRLAQSKKKIKVKMPSTKPSRSDLEMLSDSEIKAGLRLRPAWEISLMGEGQQTVLPPSIHPDTKKRYTWKIDIDSIDALPIFEGPTCSLVTDPPALPTDLIPIDIENTRLPIATIDLIKDGEGSSGDMSADAFEVTRTMVSCDFRDGEILFVMTDEDNFISQTALKRRGRSLSSRCEWISKYCIRPARENSARSAFANIDEEFDDPTAHRNTTPFPLLDNSAKIGIIKTFVDRVESQTEADEANLIFQLIAAIGSALGRSSYFVVGSDKHFPNIFVGVVGNSSKARKGTGVGIVREEIANKIDTEWASNRIHSGLSTGEGLIHAVRDGNLEEDENDDDFDLGVLDKRLLVIESEFSSILKRACRSENTLSQIIRDAWDGKRLQTLTKNKAQTATEAHISIVGQITREELRKELSDVDISNGFANRFIWVAVKRNKLVPLGGDIASLKFDDIIEQLKCALVFAKQKHRIKFDLKAETLWVNEYPQLSAEYDGIIGKLTARSEAQTLRLALIYALLDCSTHITETHLKAALALWSYSRQSCEYIWGKVTISSDQQKILAALKEVPRSRTFITRDIFQKNKSREQVQGILDGLVQKKMVETYQEDKTEMWRAVRTTNRRNGGF